jgi:prepilin-type N-terminal cleavage/methylation domain-containing protein
MQTALTGKRGSQAGMTLIEMLVSMIITAVIGTMLVGGWISLQRAYAFTRVTNSARATARDALDRVSSEIRMAQPPTADPLVKSPFYLPTTPTSPFASGSPLSACGPTTCVFYSAYNNSALEDGGGLALTGTTPPSTSRMRLTAIWLDTAGSTAQKVLKLTRDTDNDGDLSDPGGFRTIVLARSVVNTAASVNRPIFTYYFRDALPSSPYYGQWSHANTLTSTGSTGVANLRNVQIELVVDVNLSHTPTYVDVRTTVRPRNAAAVQ